MEGDQRMPKPRKKKRNDPALLGVWIAVAMGIGAGAVVGFKPAPPPDGTDAARTGRPQAFPAQALQGQTITTQAIVAQAATTQSLPTRTQTARLSDQQRPTARTAALTRDPNTQPEARLWIIEQLDIDMNENPARRETALSTCVISEKGKADTDWLGVMACYRRLLAAAPTRR